MKLTLKSIGAVAAGLWGGLHPMFQTLLCLMALDILSGLLAAYIKKEVTSEASFRGMAKKGLIVLLVGGSVALNRAWSLDLPLGVAVAGFYCIHEMISITENAARAELPLPPKLLEVLKKLNAGVRD